MATHSGLHQVLPAPNVAVQVPKNTDISKYQRANNSPR